MKTDKAVQKTIIVKAPLSKVWDTLTNPMLIKDWLYGTTVISDWKVGSSILFTGSWDGTEYTDKGTILKFETEKVFQYNYWSSFSSLPDIPENYSVITFHLELRNDETVLTLTQSGFANETIYEHSDTNWTETLETIKNQIENSS